jgi:hypothetical protein
MTPGASKSLFNRQHSLEARCVSCDCFEADVATVGTLNYTTLNPAVTSSMFMVGRIYNFDETDTAWACRYDGQLDADSTEINYPLSNAGNLTDNPTIVDSGLMEFSWIAPYNGTISDLTLVAEDVGYTVEVGFFRCRLASQPAGPCELVGHNVLVSTTSPMSTVDGVVCTFERGDRLTFAQGTDTLPDSSGNSFYDFSFCVTKTD